MTVLIMMWAILNNTSSGWQDYLDVGYHYNSSILIDANETHVIHKWTCELGTGWTQWNVIRYYH